MTEHNHAYLADLAEKHDLAVRYEATFNEWADFADQMTVAYSLWVELYEAATEAIVTGHVGTRLASAQVRLERFTRDFAGSEV